MPHNQTLTPIPAMKKTKAAFAILLVGVVGYFVYWGLGYTQYNQPMLFLLATLFGVFMAFNIGGNDVANSFGTSVGAGTLTVPQALLIAAVFEVSGAIIAGGEVTATIRSGIVNLEGLPMQPLDLVFIMMSALLAAALWLLIATFKGLPVSTTHAIIGGIVGSSVMLGFLISNNDISPWATVKWSKIGSIAISWVLSPVLGAAASYGLFTIVKKCVLDYNARAEEALKTIKAEKRAYKDQHNLYMDTLPDEEKIKLTQNMAADAAVYAESDYNPSELQSDYYKKMHEFEQRKDSLNALKALQTWVPIMAAISSVMVASIVIFKGLNNLNLHITPLIGTLLMLMIAAAVWFATFLFAKNLKRKELSKSTFVLFSWMQVVTASAFAFSHGANDIANAIGPFAAIMDVLRTNSIGKSAPVPPVAMLTFGVALVVGLWFVGKEVIQTVGKGLAELHPASGFTAELSAAVVVMAASVMGLPVSSTHILVGAVLGIGLVNRNANWAMMKPIGLAWVITLPAAAVLSVICFLILRGIFA